MTDEGPQKPPRGRRARGSADPGPDYAGDLPRRTYPSPQYPEIVPGQRRRAGPGDSQAAQDYPAPPGNRGRLAEDAASGHGRAAPPGESPVGYGPRTPAGEYSSGYGRAAAPADYGRAGTPGESARGYDRAGASGSRHLAGPAARVRRRAVSDVPVHRATGPAATHAPPQAKCPVTPGPLRRARQPPVRDGERTPARAGGVTRRLPHADRTMPGAITAGAMRADASRARGGAGRSTP